jgi:RNA polymerase sigma-70 factor (ECF subfamily)
MYADTPSLDALVVQAQRGDAYAVERLLHISYPKLLRLARSLVRSDDVARDVVQETMLALSMNIADLRNPGAFNTWAGQILRRFCFSHFRRRRREHHVTHVDASAIVALVDDADTSDTVVRDELLEAVESLGGKSREVVSLHYFLGLSIQEIADTVDASAGAVKVRLHRARIELRGRLAPSDAGQRLAMRSCSCASSSMRSTASTPPRSRMRRSSVGPTKGGSQKSGSSAIR